MFSGTGQLAQAISAGPEDPGRPVSFSDTYGPTRKYLKHRFPGMEVHKDFRDQTVPEGAIVTIGAPCQDLSVAGKHVGAERNTGTRSSLIHEALDMAVAGVADFIVAENVLDRCDLSVSAQRRLAGNAVVGLQARLMLQRGLTAVNDTRGNL